MRTAASLGVLSYAGDRAFGLTGRGQLLRAGVPGSLRDLALAFTGSGHWQSWSQFPDAIREGTSQLKRVTGADIFGYYARPENAEEARIFAGSMADVSALTIQGAMPRSTSHACPRWWTSAARTGSSSSNSWRPTRATGPGA